jgi:integrase
VLVDALAAHLVGHDGGLVFRSPRNMALHHANWRNNVWVPALGKADLGKSPTIHDLRHTYASHLVQAGVPLEKVRLLLGHTSISTTLRYAHFAPDHAMDAVKALNGIWSGVPEAYATHVEGR